MDLNENKTIEEIEKTSQAGKRTLIVQVQDAGDLLFPINLERLKYRPATTVRQMYGVSDKKLVYLRVITMSFFIPLILGLSVILLSWLKVWGVILGFILIIILLYLYPFILYRALILTQVIRRKAS